MVSSPDFEFNDEHYEVAEKSTPSKPILKKEEEIKKEDTSYPYAYAEELIRSIAGYLTPNDTGNKLSRSDASRILQKVAEILELDFKYVSSKLSDYYLEHKNELTENSITDFLSSVIDRK